MADSDRKHRLNKDTVADNQTIFDFLKRKKQFNLQNTVNKSLQVNSNSKPKYEVDLDSDFPQTKDQSKYHTYDMSNKYAKTAKQQTITPKKIQFEDQYRGQQNIREKTIQNNPGEQAHRKGKSFLSMISPVRVRASSALEERKEQKNNIKESSQKALAKGNKSDSFVRRNLSKCITNLKDNISNLTRNINILKDKSHGLTVLFNPIFNYLNEGNHPVSKQIGELRNKLKSLQVFIQEVSSQNCGEDLQIFHRNLQEHLQTLEAQIRRQALRSKNDELSQLKNDKQAVVQKLQNQLKKAIKDNETLIRKIQKIQNSKGEIVQAITQREVNYVQQIQRMKSSYQKIIEELKSKNQNLQNKVQTSTQQVKYLEKEYKNEKMLKQSISNRMRDELQQVTQSKDAYLLNEIMVLKAEFNADLNRVNQLHKIKESELLVKIGKKEEELNKKSFENGCNKQVESKILQQANLIKHENLQLKTQLKTQADCLITDMYRMNEQLYQHWMALKDIKLLSTRLGSYLQYRQIYEELGFNDHFFQ